MTGIPSEILSQVIPLDGFVDWHIAGAFKSTEDPDYTVNISFLTDDGQIGLIGIKRILQIRE